MKTYLLAAAAAVAAVATALALDNPAHAQASGPYLGEMLTVPYNFCPRGWVPAQGQILPINQYQALFALIGTLYGGDGRTNFALPHPQAVPVTSGPGLTQCIAISGVFPSRG